MGDSDSVDEFLVVYFKSSAWHLHQKQGIHLQYHDHARTTTVL